MAPNATAMCASYALSLGLALLCGLHLYWAGGGTWGFAAALGQERIDPTVALRLASAAVALALGIAAAGVLGRVGLWGRFLPWALFFWGTWLLVVALLLAALLNLTARTWLERLVFAPTALALAVLALVVARSARS